MLWAPTSAAHRIRGLTAAHCGASHGVHSVHRQARQQRGSCSHKLACFKQQRSWQGASCVLMCRHSRSAGTTAAAQQSQQTSAADAEDLLIVGALMVPCLATTALADSQPATLLLLGAPLCARLQAQASWGATWASCGGSSTPARPWSAKPTRPTTTHGEAPCWPPAQLCVLTLTQALPGVCELRLHTRWRPVAPPARPRLSFAFQIAVAAGGHNEEFCYMPVVKKLCAK